MEGAAAQVARQSVAVAAALGQTPLLLVTTSSSIGIAISTSSIGTFPLGVAAGGFDNISIASTQLKRHFDTA